MSLGVLSREGRTMHRDKSEDDRLAKRYFLSRTGDVMNVEQNLFTYFCVTSVYCVTSCSHVQRVLLCI